MCNFTASEQFLAIMHSGLSSPTVHARLLRQFFFAMGLRKVLKTENIPAHNGKEQLKVTYWLRSKINMLMGFKKCLNHGLFCHSMEKRFVKLAPTQFSLIICVMQVWLVYNGNNVWAQRPVQCTTVLTAKISVVSSSSCSWSMY